MSDTPKFEVIDRRKFKAAEEEQESHKDGSLPEAQSTPVESSAPSSGPQLVVNEGRNAPVPAPVEAVEIAGGEEAEGDLPPAPTAEESHQQKAAYDASAQRLEDIIRAQNPAVGVGDLVEDLFPQGHAAIFIAVQPLAAEETIEDPPCRGQGRLVGHSLARIGGSPAGKSDGPAPRRSRFRGSAGPKLRNLHLGLHSACLAGYGR